MVRFPQRIIQSRPIPQTIAGQASRPASPKASGLVLEARFQTLVRQLPGVIRGQWFEYVDEQGLHYAQPDFILPVADGLVVVECKALWYHFSKIQLATYTKIVSKAWPGRQVWGMGCANRARSKCLRVTNLDDGLRLCKLTWPVVLLF